MVATSRSRRALTRRTGLALGLAALSGATLTATGAASKIADALSRSTLVLSVIIVVVVAVLVIVAVMRTAAAIEVSDHATTDELTGLPERDALGGILSDSLDRARSARSRIVVALVHVRRLDEINRMFGHDVGDLALSTVSARLAEAAGDGRELVRRAGSEFVCVSGHDDDVADPDGFAIRLLSAFSSPIDIHSFAINVEADVGITIGEPGNVEITTLTSRLEIARYRAHRQGPNHYELFERSDALEVSPSVVVGWIRTAEDDRRVLVRYQPIFTTTGDLTGVEALLRWVHPTIGELSPAVVLPALEDSGLIAEVGAAVLEEIARDRAEWGSAAAEVPTFVNVSPRQLLDHGFVPMLQATLARHGVDPSEICLELRGELPPGAYGPICEVLRECNAIGVGVALDRFGAAGSDLSLLREAPVQVVKIDRRLTGPMARTPDIHVARAVVALCDVLGVVTIAEGIERPEQAERAHEIGCRKMQGNWFAEARSSREVDRLLRELAPTGSAEVHQIADRTA